MKWLVYPWLGGVNSLDSAVRRVRSLGAAGIGPVTLPCEARKTGRYYRVLGRNPLCYKGFCAHCVASLPAVFRPLAYFLPTLRLKASGSWTIQDDTA